MHWLLLSLLLPLFASAAEIPLRVRFFIEPNYLIKHLFHKKSARGPGAQTVQDFRQAAFGLDSVAAARFLAWDWNDPDEVAEKAELRHGPYLRRVRALPEFRTVLAETRAYLDAAQAEWNNNLPSSYASMRELVGSDFNEEVRVYITHPAAGNGRNWSDDKSEISFGAEPSFPNYFTVYIWHEILHSHMPSDDLAHAIIQLATDCGLKEQFNGSACPPYEGHESLFPLMESLQEDWRAYRARPDGLRKFYQRQVGKK